MTIKLLGTMLGITIATLLWYYFGIISHGEAINIMRGAAVFALSMWAMEKISD